MTVSAPQQPALQSAAPIPHTQAIDTTAPKPTPRKRSFSERAEAYVSKLSTKNNFWHRVCSLIWLPFAFRSGIKMKRLDQKTFTAILPFRRFNRNWYNAMAGAALLGNSEIAGGMYVFGVCGGDYTVVCKHLRYDFLRPCLGPAVYRITPRENIEELLKGGGEFNITIDLKIFQGISKPVAGGKGEREKRVGECEATFHVTPKLHQKSKRERRQRPPTSDPRQEATSSPAPAPASDTPPPT